MAGESSPLLARPGATDLRRHRKLLILTSAALFALCGLVYAGLHAQQPNALVSEGGPVVASLGEKATERLVNITDHKRRCSKLQ